MTDLIARLRAAAAHPYNQHGPHEFLTEAAARIERLEVALRTVDDEHGYGLPPETRQMIRAALEEKA